jgi:hypothetical protein
MAHGADLEEKGNAEQSEKKRCDDQSRSSELGFVERAPDCLFDFNEHLVAFFDFFLDLAKIKAVDEVLGRDEDRV